MNQFGLSKDKIIRLQTLFYQYKEIEAVILYGSRAKGNYQPFSDVDITLKGDQLNSQILADVIFGVDDLLLPYTFDISIFNDISNPDVVDHINRVGKLLYDRSTFLNHFRDLTKMI